MIKNLSSKVSTYYKSLDKNLNYSVANETIFRLLGDNNFNYKNKKILDIGIGNGDNLLEFQRRGAEIFGIDIRRKIIQLFIKKNKLNSKNYFCCDLNKDFPKINKKFDLVLCKDTLYYLESERQFALFDYVKNILKKRGFFLFQYIQTQLKQNRNNLFSFNLCKKKLFDNMISYFKRKNPLPFLKTHHIKKLLQNQNFKIKKNFFDLNIHTKNKKTIYTVNRFFLIQKI